MKKNVIILVAEDDDGHFLLIKKGFVRAGIDGEILQFKDGAQILDFLFMRGDGPKRTKDQRYLLLLDIKMPIVDGVEVLKQIKQDGELRKIPTAMLTTTDEPQSVELCHDLGCSMYLVKPTRYEKFAEMMLKIGPFLSTLEVPQIS